MALHQQNDGSPLLLRRQSSEDTEESFETCFSMEKSLRAHLTETAKREPTSRKRRRSSWASPPFLSPYTSSCFGYGTTENDQEHDQEKDQEPNPKNLLHSLQADDVPKHVDNTDGIASTDTSYKSVTASSSCSSLESLERPYPMNARQRSFSDNQEPRSVTSTNASDVGLTLEAASLERPYAMHHRQRSYSDAALAPAPLDVTPIDLGLRQRQPLSIRQEPRLRSTSRSRRRSTSRTRRSQRTRGEQESHWLISASHPYKITWDVLTIILSIISAYCTHESIRDRKFERSPFIIFCEVWFVLDMMLNFVTTYKTIRDDGGLVHINSGKAVWARYLTTWFVVDLLSLVPWEALYIQPVIERQNRRNFVVKNFFRTKAVIRVTRVLRGRHFKLFGQVAKKTRHAGVGATRLLRLLIKYVPKYLLFYRNMKGVLAVRTLRQVHWCRKVLKNLYYKHVKEDDATDSMTHYSDAEDDDEDVEYSFQDSTSDNDFRQVQVSWQYQVSMDEDDQDDSGPY